MDCTKQSRVVNGLEVDLVHGCVKSSSWGRVLMALMHEYVLKMSKFHQQAFFVS